MTDDFQRGLITGLAMQPLQVTTEHAKPDAPASTGGDVIFGEYTVIQDTIVSGIVIVLDVPQGGTA